MNLAAVILAGGESRRMGHDKAWLEFNGEPLVARALSLVRRIGIDELFISGRAGVDYSRLGCPVLFDAEPGGGPLGGIQRALETARAPLLLVLAVDLPHMTAEFLRKLVAMCEPPAGVVPRLGGRFEPLAAIYPQRSLAIARGCWLNGRRAVRDFAAACLSEGVVRTFDIAAEEAGCFENWNTPADISKSGTGPPDPPSQRPPRPPPGAQFEHEAL